jgi:hypothetical protein
MRPRGQPRAGDAQGQRQIFAVLGDLCRRVGLVLDPVRADDARKQIQRLTCVQGIHTDMGDPG